ncbi:phospholipase A and acyltransferase 2-like [Mercenaria mercenaria]|uniref:phospholipase A and acyltransferase 2-like n=1 Tax=Mercenaria mercenaria TaxID=6596 RepID=UPI00234E7A89|nr:phospholipase A and acyltransferase 2-like [Mercenaria mercenaria]
MDYAYDPVETTSRANAKIGKSISDLWKKCEDFATYSRYGTAVEQIFVHNRKVLRKLQEGDLIEIRRGIGYSHWAVYVGNEEVVHYTSADQNACLDVMNKAEIKCEGYWNVAKGTKVLINNFNDNKINPFEPDEITKRARSEVGRSGYNAIWRNCEHFATECRYGEPSNEQVQRRVVFVFAIIVLCAGAFLLRRTSEQR